jgi:hypothetical protein
MSIYIKSILFDIVSTSANYGKIVADITDTIPILGGRNVYYEISGPLSAITGTLIYAPNFNVPNGFIDISNPTASMPIISIPLDSNGQFQEGQYTIKFYIQEVSNVAAPQEIESSTFLLDVLKQGPNDCELRGKINVELNCHCYTMTITDATNYRGATIISRTLTIRPPAIPSNTPAPAPIVTAFPSYTLPFTHTNVTYTIGLYTIYETSFDNGSIIVREDLDASYSERVKCDFNLCSLIDCIRKEYNKLVGKMSNVGGWAYLLLNEQDWWLLIENKIVLLYQYLNCKKWDKVDEIYAEIKKLIDCDCDCGGGNADTPIAVAPDCGGSGGVTNITGSYPIEVNQAGTSAIISLDSSYTTGINNSIINLTNLVNAMQASIVNLQNTRLTNVTATNTIGGFLTVSSPSATTRAVNFNANGLAYSAWLKITNAQANNSYGAVDFDNTPRPLQYRQNDFLEKIDLQGTFRFNGHIIGTAICITNNVGISASPVAGFLPIICTDAQGKHVGTLRLVPNPLGTLSTLLFTHTINYATNSIVYVNGSFNKLAI